MITLTKLASVQVDVIMKEQELNAGEHYLRVGVAGGGCSGFSYTLDITEDKRDTDEEFDHHGITLICDRASYLYLKGTEIDFKDEVLGRGFVFKNPNSTSSCGCGSSFNV